MTQWSLHTVRNTLYILPRSLSLIQHICLCCYMPWSWEMCQVWSAWDMLLWYSSACVTKTQSRLRTASSLLTDLIPSDSFHIISASSPRRKREGCKSGGWEWINSRFHCWILWQCENRNIKLIITGNWHCVVLRITGWLMASYSCLLLCLNCMINVPILAEMYLLFYV